MNKRQRNKLAKKNYKKQSGLSLSALSFREQCRREDIIRSALGTSYLEHIDYVKNVIDHLGMDADLIDGFRTTQNEEHQ